MKLQRQVTNRQPLTGQISAPAAYRAWLPVNLVSDRRVERGRPAYRFVCRSAIVYAGVLYQG
jgi:hypothetical protein